MPSLGLATQNLVQRKELNALLPAKFHEDCGKKPQNWPMTK